MNLNEVMNTRINLLDQEKKMYLTAVNQINSEMQNLLSNDMGSQFVQSCGRDLAGELIRTYFDASDYNITVDQLAERIIKFSYDDEYDPLAKNTDVQKLVYNYNDSNSSTMKSIINDLEKSKVKLFEKQTVTQESGKTKSDYIDKSMITEGKQAYRNSRNNDGTMKDDYTGNAEEKKTNSRGAEVSQLDVEHTQALSTAYTYNRYLKECGQDRIKEFYNSSDNFAMMWKTANQSKGDVKVFDKNGNDITYKATPEQMVEAVANRLESCKKKDALMEKGYLGEDGKISKNVKNELLKNYKKSQNTESKVILKNTDYKKVGKDAGKHTVNAIGKILGGQIIYYTMPPLLYEIRIILKDKNITLDNFFKKLDAAKKRLCNYVISKLKDIFKNVLSSSMKKFIRSFFDIIINMVKSTVKKMLKLAKNIVMSVVDAVKIIGNKNATTSEKADSVFNLFSITITSFVIEVLMEYIEKQFAIPEALLSPLQTIITVICTNIVMLILQKADLFDIRYGLLISNIKETFEKENKLYTERINLLKFESEEKIGVILNQVNEEIAQIKQQFNDLNIFSNDVKIELEKVNEIFNMNINFEEEWNRYIGVAL